MSKREQTTYFGERPNFPVMLFHDRLDQRSCPHQQFPTTIVSTMI
jgi:hypothetical protein